MEMMILGVGSDGKTVIDRFTYAASAVDSTRLFFVCGRDYTARHWVKSDDALIVVREDLAVFAVPVSRSIPQLRSRSRVTRTPRRVDADQEPLDGTQSLRHTVNRWLELARNYLEYKSKCSASTQCWFV